MTRITKKEHRDFYSGKLSKTCSELPSISTSRKQRSPTQCRSPGPSSPDSLADSQSRQQQLLTSWRPVLDFELTGTDLESHQLDGRDYFSILGVPPDATGAELDIAYTSRRHEWNPANVVKNYPHTVTNKAARNDLMAKYTKVSNLLKAAHNTLSYSTFRVQYEQHIDHRDSLINKTLPAWTDALYNVVPVTNHEALDMLRGLKMPIPTTCVLSDRGAICRVLFTNSQGVIKCKKSVPRRAAQIVAAITENSLSQSEASSSSDRIVGTWIYEPGVRDSTGETLVLKSASEAEVTAAVECPEAMGRLLLHSEVDATSLWRNTYQVQEGMNDAQYSTCCAEDLRIRVYRENVQDCTREDRKAKTCEMLGAHTRGIVSHIERTHDCRVLKVSAQYLINPEGSIFLTHLTDLFVCSLRPWSKLRTDSSWLGKHIEKHIKKPLDEDAPVYPAELFSEAELRATWPLLQAAPRTEPRGKPLRTHFGVSPERGNNWSERVRKMPQSTVSPNFWRNSRYVRRKGKQQLVLDPAKKNMQKIAVNRHIIRKPFESERFSVAMPGRFLESTEQDLRKPWEFTARHPFSQLWTAPKPRCVRQGPDPYGLELRELQKKTKFKLGQLYELYGHFFRFAQTPQGNKDREITMSAENNFIEAEFLAMLAKCGIVRTEVSQRIFIQFAQPVGFGRKKRILLPFVDATLAMCAFGISTRNRQALSLLQIMDEDGGGTVSRAELLAFIEHQMPEGVVISKLEMFKRVSAIFGRLDEDGGGEIDTDEWLDGLTNDDEVYEQIQALIPYKKFFKNWVEGDTSLTPVLEALAATDPEDNLSIVRQDRTQHLTQQIQGLLKGVVDQKKIPIQAAVGYMMQLGVDQGWAERECNGMCSSQNQHIPIDEYVERMVTLGEMNPAAFDEMVRCAENENYSPYHD